MTFQTNTPISVHDSHRFLSWAISD